MGKDFKKLFYCGLVFAQPVALAEEIRREYRSARHLGMGDAGTATATGVDAIFYNPAGMANTNGKMLSEIVLASPQFSLGDDTRKFAKWQNLPSARQILKAS